MPLNTTVLFDLPQQEIATIIQSKLRASQATSIVTGFMTAEGAGILEPALLANPVSAQAIVIGAGTYQAYDAIDRLIAAGIPQQRLFVHLGHTRPTGGKAKHKFYRHHPMLHSKVYYTEHADGSASAFIGSHNVTGYALSGLNGEAAVLLEGSKDSPEFDKVRRHIRESIQQSVAYSPGMKQAYAWWTHQSIQGLGDKANDFPREGEAKKTIVILAEIPPGRLPKRDDTVYFELPSALGTIYTLNAEVHIYLFDQLPPSPIAGLRALHTARTSLWCRTEGLEMEHGGVELQADWRIDNPKRPILQAVTPPLRPSPTSGAQQVRVRAYNDVREEFEYLFEVQGATWMPVVDRGRVVKPGTEQAPFLAKRYYKPNPEHLDWYLVTGLERVTRDDSDIVKALAELSPGEGSYVMMSLRRRQLGAREEEQDSES